MNTIQASPFANTPVPPLKAGQSVRIVAPKGTDGAKTNDFGLYGNGGTRVTQNGVTIAATDYEVHRVFMFGPNAVAHLFTHDNEVIVTAGDEDIGSFFVVLKTNRGNDPRLFRGQIPVRA